MTGPIATIIQYCIERVGLCTETVAVPTNDKTA